MVENKVKVESKRIDDKIQVIQSNIDLEDQNKEKVGTRVIIDEYSLEQTSMMIDQLKEQLAKAEKQRVDTYNDAQTAAKEFNKREEEAIKAQINLRNKEKAYMIVKNSKTSLPNIDDQIEVIKKEITKWSGELNN